MVSYNLMTLNLGNGETHQKGAQERVKAAVVIIKEALPDILFVQNISGKRSLELLKLDDIYLSQELPYSRESPHTAVLWKKDTVSLWKPPKRGKGNKEKANCDKNMVEDRYFAVNISGPNSEKICFVSYEGFHYKPKGCGEGVFSKGEKRKLTKDFLKCLKEKNVDGIIIGGSFLLSAEDTPRESVFQKAHSDGKVEDFFMLTNKTPSFKCSVSNVRRYEGCYTGLKSCPVVGVLELPVP